MRLPVVRLAAASVAVLALATCRPQPFRVPVPLGLDLFAPIPDDNALTRDRVALGKRLFFDSSLSADGSRSCSSCHRPGHAFSDTVPASSGAYKRTGVRNAPSLLNVAYGSSFFWDGRASTLEAQVLVPIQGTLELGLTIPELESRLRADAGYRRDFRRAFGDNPTASDVARAIASFLRTLRSGDAPIDRFRHGDTTALSPLARQGLALFNGRARCSACHVGPTFADGDFHNTGVAWHAGAWRDVGRAAVTGRAEDRGAFKTPTLRNVTRTAPFMHDGSIATLEDVIDFYDRGGRPNPTIDPMIRPLRLTAEERQALLEFLRALTS
jgi:cytochrome c peroxidase